MGRKKDRMRACRDNAQHQSTFCHPCKSHDSSLFAAGVDLLKFLLEPPGDPVRRQFLEFAVAILQAGMEVKFSENQINMLPTCCDPKWVHAAGIAPGSRKDDTTE